MLASNSIVSGWQCFKLMFPAAFPGP